MPANHDRTWSRTTAMVALGASLWIVACGPVQHREQRYGLGPPPVLDAPVHKAPSVGVRGLAVGRLRAPAYLRDSRIAYRYGPYAIGTYDEHRWSAPPTDLLRLQLIRTLKASGAFGPVDSLSSQVRAGLILGGQLYEFGEVDPDGDGPLGVHGRLTLELELLDPTSLEALGTWACDEDEPVGGADVLALVAALDRSVERCFGRLVPQLAERVAAQPPTLR